MLDGQERARKLLMNRRNFLRAAGVLSVGALSGLSTLELTQRLASSGQPALRLLAATKKERAVGFTDGFVSMPKGAEAVAPFYPDPGVPAPFTSYVFGIRDLTGLSDAEKFAQKGKAQISAPFLFCDQNADFRLHLYNLGEVQRAVGNPDNHTVHWHGFPNQIVYFDGVPDNSLAVPIGRQLIYRYIPQDPGCYIYHCHIDDVEHVHMGLSGVVFVRAALNDYSKDPPLLYAYNDKATQYDREYAFLLTELDNHAHFNDLHNQDTDWSEYKAGFRLLNGRAWPDTIEPNINPMDKNLAPRLERLRYQPNSSLIQCNEGERVLIRVANLGFEHHSMLLPGLPMTMVGRDAKPLQAGRPDYGVDPPTPGSRGDISTVSNRVDLGPGETRDLIFTAPKLPSGSGQRTYNFYDRNYGFVKAAGEAENQDGFGGMRTEVRVYPAGTLQTQPRPNAVFNFNNYPSSNTGVWTWASGTDPV